MAEVKAFACVWTGTPGECQSCGGSTKADIGDDEPSPDPRFCSLDCFEDMQEFAERARREAALDWCPECGFDRHEHADACPRSRPAGAAPSQTAPLPAGRGQSGPHAFGSPDIGYAMPAGGSTTWPESRVT